MRTRRATTIRDLRATIDCLPSRTREAMLAGIRANDIVVGAYTHDGGICPMLAAHRAGGRTDCIAFARAWDGFTLGTGRAARQARRATERELRVLVSHLEASLLEDVAPARVGAPRMGESRTGETEAGELARAIAEHRALREARLARDPVAPGRKRSRRAAAPRPGDPDRGPELSLREGWAWTRPFRRLEDYERALLWVEEWVVAEERTGSAAQTRA